MAVIVALAGLGFLPARASASTAPFIDQPLLSPHSLALSWSTATIQPAICLAAVAVITLLWFRKIIRPASLGPPGGNGGRDLSGMPIPVWFGCALALFMALPLGVDLAHRIPSSILGADNSMRRSAIVFLTAYAFASACSALLIYFILPRATPASGFSFHRKDLATGAGIYLLVCPIPFAVSIISAFIFQLITGHAPPAIAHDTLQQIVDEKSNPWTIGVIIAVCVGAPFIEELVYRLFLHSALVKLVSSRWTAVILSSAAFALVHRASETPVPWHAIPTLFVLGVCNAVALERTRRITVPIVMHGLFNATNIAVTIFT